VPHFYKGCAPAALHQSCCLLPSRLLPQVSHVVQFDLPADVPAYLHRIGRTARAGTKGLGEVETSILSIAQLREGFSMGITIATRCEQQRGIPP